VKAPPTCATSVDLRWWFTLVLGATYLGIFHLWWVVSSPWIARSGLSVSAGLGTLLLLAAKRQYFVNVWDELFHAAVILDIVLEATLIKQHEPVGFYLCAAAFAVVLIGYRVWWLRSRRRP